MSSLEKVYTWDSGRMVRGGEKAWKGAEEDRRKRAWSSVQCSRGKEEMSGQTIGIGFGDQQVIGDLEKTFLGIRKPSVCQT